MDPREREGMDETPEIAEAHTQEEIDPQSPASSRFGRRSSSEAGDGAERGAPEAQPTALAACLRRRMDQCIELPPNFERLVLGCIDASKQASTFGPPQKKKRNPGIRAQLKYA